MCTKAVEWGYLKTNPLSLVKFLKEPPGRLRYLTSEEMGLFVEACSPHLRPIVVTALNTGMPRVIPMNQTLYLTFRMTFLIFMNI